jgi:hypothetical protein
MILALFLYHQRILAFSALCDDQVVRNNGKQNETKKLEVISKPQIRSKGKASGRSGKRSPANGGMSKYIYRRPVTQPLGLRWGFEIIFNIRGTPSSQVVVDFALGKWRTFFH